MCGWYVVTRGYESETFACSTGCDDAMSVVWGAFSSFVTGSGLGGEIVERPTRSIVAIEILRSMLKVREKGCVEFRD